MIKVFGILAVLFSLSIGATTVAAEDTWALTHEGFIQTCAVTAPITFGPFTYVPCDNTG